MLRVKPSFVQGIQIVNNMHELRPIKYLFVFVNFNIGAYEATHPIIGDDHWWENLKLTERFQSNQSKKHHLFGHESSTFSIIWPWKEFGIVEPNVIHPFIITLMNTKFILKMRLVDFNVSVICESISG